MNGQVELDEYLQVTMRIVHTVTQSDFFSDTLLPFVIHCEIVQWIF